MRLSQFIEIAEVQDNVRIVDMSVADARTLIDESGHDELTNAVDNAQGSVFMDESDCELVIIRVRK